MISKTTFDTYVEVSQQPTELTFEKTEGSEVTAKITYSTRCVFNKPESELTKEDVDEVKRRLYKEISSPVLSDDQFAELMRLIDTRTRYTFS